MTKNPTAFETRYGFPRSAVTLANWRTEPYNRWAFQNVSEMVRSVEVTNAGRIEDMMGLGALETQSLSIAEATETVGSFLARSGTDTFTVMKSGRFVADHVSPTATWSAPHIAFSISKSLTAILAGTLIDEGKLDPAAPILEYVPEMQGSAYADATVQQLSDMRLSLDFIEDYLDTEGAFARYRRATMWNPGGGEESLLQFIASIKKGPGQHGGPFCYRSPNSDLLGIVAERASGQRLSDLFLQRLWTPLSCAGRVSIAVDREGTARAAGGISITARDLARVGEMMRLGGVGTAGRVVSERWVRDTTTGGDKAAWKAGDMAHLFADGAYRNKWYATGLSSGAFCGIGIHGQWVYVDPKREVVIVKMSSQALPVDDLLDKECLVFFDQIADMV